MPTTDKKYDWYIKGFEQLEKSLNGESKSPIHSVRKDALARFVELGFPTTRDEEWRFTNIAPIRNTKFHPSFEPRNVSVGIEQLNKLVVTDTGSIRIVFVNGHFAPTLSSIPSKAEGLQVGSLAEAVKKRNQVVNQHLARHAHFDSNAFVALNTSYILDGAFVNVQDGVAVETPIECVFVTTESGQEMIVNPRNLFVFGRNARGTIVENHVSLHQSSCLNNVVTEIVVGEDAVVEHDKLEAENENSFHVGTTHVRQAAKSNYTNNAVSLGGKIVRNNITVVLADEHAEATLNGLSLGTGDQLVDSHTTIDHTVPNCASREVYKAILDGKAKGVFNGKVYVRQDAQKTDAKQTNKTLLLSDEATVNTKPQLEIFADDVKCTHGAAVGQLDEEQIFYLRSRGIGERSARDFLTFAFASDVVERMHTDSLREKLRGLIHARLEEGRNAGRTH